jgi:hypothetical protein
MKELKKHNIFSTYTSKWSQVPMKSCPYKSFSNVSAPLRDVPNAARGTSLKETETFGNDLYGY